MMPAISIENFAAWCAQIFIIAAAGGLLSAIFRIRDAHANLVYRYLLLAACLTLPLIQPWRQPVSVAKHTPRGSPPPEGGHSA